MFLKARYLLAAMLVFGLASCGKNHSAKTDKQGSHLSFISPPDEIVPGFSVCYDEYNCLIRLNNNTNRIQVCDLKIQVNVANQRDNRGQIWSDRVTGIEVETDSVTTAYFNLKQPLKEIREITNDPTYKLTGPIPDTLSGSCKPLTEEGPTIIDLNSQGQLQTVDIAAGKTVTGRLKIEQAGLFIMETSGSFDTLLDLHHSISRDTLGGLIESDDNSGVSTNAKIESTLNPGFYFIKIRLKSTFDSSQVQLKIGPAGGSGADWCQSYRNDPESFRTVQILSTLTGEPDCTKAYKALKEMDTFLLQNTSIRNLKPLTAFPQITKLYLMNTPVSDISPVSSLQNLLLLYLDRSQVEDLNPVRNLSKLTAIGLSFTKVRNLSPLYGINSLRYIDLSGATVSPHEVDQLRMRLPQAGIRY